MSTRSRTDTSRVDGSSTGNRSLLTGICVSGPALFHISKVVVSLSFSPDFDSLHCRSKDANQRDPSSSNNLFPSRSSRNRIVIRSHTWISFSVSWALRWNRVESRPASLIPMARWLGRQRVAPGLGVVPR